MGDVVLSRRLAHFVLSATSFGWLEGDKMPARKKSPVLRQAPKRSRGIAKKPRKGNQNVVTRTPGPKPKKSNFKLDGFNAFNDKMHIPLPLSTGKYIVVRTMATFNSNEAIGLFGTNTIVRGDNGTATGGDWTNVVARFTGVSDVIGQGVWTERSTAPLGSDSGLGGMAELTPAAFSVRVINPNALQTTSGSVYVGRCTSALHTPASTDGRTGTTLMNQLLAYKAPAQMSASQLAMRPIRIDAVPTDLSTLSKFTNLSAVPDNRPGVQWNDNATVNCNSFEGFAPIFVYNPSGVSLNYQVAIEWRLRVDPLNPMGASAKSQGYTPPNVWNDLIKGMESLGHGVVDAIEWAEGFV